ncbi:MAG: GntR family transcriptional regulator [Pseudomonadota bacterium]
MEIQFSLTAYVANHIRRLIELQKLRPGDLVPLEEIEKTLSVSRTPAREAIRQLELEHLVSIEPGRGAYVSPISRAELADLYGLRKYMEVKAAGLAAGSISDYDLSILADNVGEYADLAGDPERLTLLDRQFHYTIFEACGNRHVEKTLKSLRIRMGLLRQPAYHNMQRVACTLAEHKAVLAALQNRDAAAAEQAMYRHIQNAWDERDLQEGMNAFS